MFFIIAWHVLTAQKWLPSMWLKLSFQDKNSHVGIENAVYFLILSPFCEHFSVSPYKTQLNIEM